MTAPFLVGGSSLLCACSPYRRELNFWLPAFMLRPGDEKYDQDTKQAIVSGTPPGLLHHCYVHPLGWYLLGKCPGCCVLGRQGSNFLPLQSIVLQNSVCETSLTLPFVTFSSSIIDVTSSRNDASAEWYANETSSTLQCQN